MAYNNISNQFELTRWVSPADGNLLDIGEIYLSYNYITYELINHGIRKRKSEFKNFLNRYEWGYPSSLIPDGDSYYNYIPAANGTMQLFLNNKELTLNLNYTYSYKYQKFTLINIDTTKKNVGILSCKYKPKDKKYLFGEITSDPNIGNVVKIKKIPSIYIFETINSIRKSIENIWYFLKKEKPLWIGGVNNQETSSNNIIKFITPIISEHILEIMSEVSKISEYINFKFSESFLFNTEIIVTENSYLDGNLLYSIMETINNFETKLNDVVIAGVTSEEYNLD